MGDFLSVRILGGNAVLKIVVYRLKASTPLDEKPPWECVAASTERHSSGLVWMKVNSSNFFLVWITNMPLSRSGNTFRRRFLGVKAFKAHTGVAAKNGYTEKITNFYNLNLSLLHKAHLYQPFVIQKTIAPQPCTFDHNFFLFHFIYASNLKNKIFMILWHNFKKYLESTKPNWKFQKKNLSVKKNQGN